VLGRTGLKVSVFSLGVMNFGGSTGAFVNHGQLRGADARRLVDVAIEAGINLFDTADAYSLGESEEVLGEALARRRDQVLVATKTFSPMGPGPNDTGSASHRVIAACEASLRRLKTDYIDLYQLHNQDLLTDPEETLRALDDLVTAGKVRYVGFSDVPAWVAAEAQTTAAFRGLSPIIALQLEYSLLERTVEGELLPMAQAHGMGVMPWSPLKSGFLSGKYTRGSNGSVDTRRGELVGAPSERDFDVIDVLHEVAAEVPASPAAVALAWVQSRPGVTSTLIGARRLDHLQANLGALDVTLTDAQVAALDAASEPALDFPAENNRFLAPMVGFAGTTVDGRTAPPSPLLAASPTRY
jgi:aryl-alcohol dehydrogenase-like predicted oxidoreductase